MNTNAPANTSLSGLTANTLYDVRLSDACGGRFSTTVNVKTMGALISKKLVQPLLQQPIYFKYEVLCRCNVWWKNHKVP